MIIRPLEPLPATSKEFLPAWSVTERSQRQRYDACWMITQPSHAVLAGDFAAKLTGSLVPRLDAAIIRAISLHDAGWGIPDAQAIMQSRAASQGYPRSFIECGVGEFLAAWEKSIDVAASAGPAGGYMVSRHFARIAKHSAAQIPASDRHKATRFLEQEARRQEQLAGKQNHTTEELEALTDVLQFCDLLSLYVCSGAQENAEFPEYFGTKARLTVEADGYRLNPSLIEPGRFTAAALRHPATREESGREIEIKFL